MIFGRNERWCMVWFIMNMVSFVLGVCTTTPKSCRRRHSWQLLSYNRYRIAPAAFVSRQLQEVVFPVPDAKFLTVFSSRIDYNEGDEIRKVSVPASFEFTSVISWYATELDSFVDAHSLRLSLKCIPDEMVARQFRNNFKYVSSNTKSELLQEINGLLESSSGSSNSCLDKRLKALCGKSVREHLQQFKEMLKLDLALQRDSEQRTNQTNTDVKKLQTDQQGQYQRNVKYNYFRHYFRMERADRAATHMRYALLRRSMLRFRLTGSVCAAG
eukprot:gene323-719_t